MQANHYMWIITKDLINEGSDEGRTGPRHASKKQQTWMRTFMGHGDMLPDNAERFKLYDCDGKQYYQGILFTLPMAKSYFDDVEFSPLDDFGMPNAGCTGIKYRNRATGKWEYL